MIVQEPERRRPGRRRLRILHILPAAFGILPAALSGKERTMLPKISLPPPTISMRSAVMLLQTQVAAAKVPPDAKSIAVEQSQAAKGLEKLLHYARTAEALATRTTPSAGGGGGRSAIMPDAHISLAQASALSALGATSVVRLSPPDGPDTTFHRMVTEMQNGPGSTGAVLQSAWITPPVRPSSS